MNPVNEIRFNKSTQPTRPPQGQCELKVDPSTGLLAQLDANGSFSPLGGEASASAEEVLEAIAEDPAASRAAIGSAALPWALSGCAGAWHIDDVETSGGKITQWNDLTGNGKHLTQSDSGKQATYESSAAVLVSGGSYDIAGGLSVNNRDFTVVQILSPNRNTSDQISSLGYLLQVGSGISVEYSYFNTTLGTPTRYVQPLETIQNGNSSFVVVGSSTGTKVFTNGAPLTEAAFTAGTSNVEKLFSNSSGASGSIAPTVAVLIFSRALLDSEVREIIAYFGAKQEGGKTLVTVGDSLTAGVGATAYENSWVNLAAKALGSSVVFSGRGGLTTATIAAIPAAQMIPPPGRAVTYAIFLGTNDLATATSAEPTLQTNLTTILSRIRTAAPNAKIALFTILPRITFFSGSQDSGGFETDRNTNNVWRRTLIGTSADILIDVAANGTIGDQADASNGTYYSDGTHPTDAGYLVITSVFVTAVSPAIRPVNQGGTGTATGSITGTGALTFTAGGTNQQARLAPSGTGSVLLGTAGGNTSWLMSQTFSNTLIHCFTPTGAPDAFNWTFLVDGTGTTINSSNGSAVKLDIGGTVKATLTSTTFTLASGVSLITPTATPASAAATGTTGMWAWDSNYIYICTATNTWKRVAIASW